MTLGHILILTFLFLTTINCGITYICSVSSLKVLEKTKSYNTAINRIRAYDKYLLNTLTLLTSATYVCLSYFWFKSVLQVSDFFITLSLVSGFVLSLLTTFFSRLCYCYACNVLLKTKFNEYECFVENFYYLVSMFLPLFIISFGISIIYIIPFVDLIRRVLVTIFILVYLVLWFLLTPHTVIITHNARKIKDKKLKEILDVLFEENGISKYKLYYWDSSKSNESNAMISGFFYKYLFVSSTLIESLTNDELKAVILHEIGHVKKHHFIKIFVYKIIFYILATVITFYSIMYDDFNIYILIGMIFLLVVIMGINLSGNRHNEDEADNFVNEKGYGKELISALRKVGYDDNSVNRLDSFFSDHPSVNDRIDKLNDKDK